jgi:hypothetical protein
VVAIGIVILATAHRLLGDAERVQAAAAAAAVAAGPASAAAEAEFEAEEKAAALSGDAD